MPFKSEAQRRLMEAVAHEPGVSEKTGVPKSVAEEFIKADSDSARDRVFAKHFSAEVPALLKPKTANEHVQEYLAMRQSIIGK
jgi:hypothetical protein